LGGCYNQLAATEGATHKAVRLLHRRKFVAKSVHGTLKAVRRALVVAVAAHRRPILKTTGDGIGQNS
jgi:hypothetical protein